MRRSRPSIATPLLMLCIAPLAAPALAQAPVQVESGGEPATLDGCEVVARINGQVVLACEMLWQVNLMLEANKDRIPPQQYAEVRRELMKRTLAGSLNTKLLYGAFKAEIPPENMPRIEDNLREPFEEREVPRLMEQLQCSNRHELEHKLAELGSSLDDARRSFNEKVIASEWVRSKVKVNEDVGPDELLNYYREHLAEYEYPEQVRWEELRVRKDRFRTPAAAYAELARLGNQAWQLASQAADAGAPAFTDLAKAHSDGLNADEGGLYDWTTVGALKSASLNQHLASAERGQLSEILETESAFHIVRVLDRKPAGRKPFTKVQNEIREKLKDQRFAQAVEAYLDELRDDARIWTAYTGPVLADVLLGRSPEQTRTR